MAIACITGTNGPFRSKFGIRVYADLGINPYPEPTPLWVYIAIPPEPVNLSAAGTGHGR